MNTPDCFKWALAFLPVLLSERNTYLINEATPLTHIYLIHIPI